MNLAAGFTEAECPDDGRNQCLRSDGSGWIIVTKAAYIASIYSIDELAEYR